MLQLETFQRTFVEVCGSRIELATKGEGRPILFLHPGQGLLGASPALGKLAQLGRVMAPSHPGFYGSDLRHSITTVDDIAYLYLDLMSSLGLRDVVLIGASFGGWVAAEIAIKCTDRIGQLILVDSLGIKISDRETRDIADMHAVDDDELAALLYENPARHRPDYASLSEADVVTITKNNEAWALFGWRPYMHNPKLLGRLTRIRIPTLVLWGDGDRVVRPSYGRAFAAEIPGALFETIAKAGHLPFVEQPDSFVARVEKFLSTVRH